jgi:3-hydroxyacyl-[acyl-carrier-protein] dehydratase
MDEKLSQVAANPVLPQHAVTLLPHKPPMLLVEALVQRQGTRAVALATLPVSGLFVTAAGILPEYFVELIAQTAALGNCYDARIGNMASHDGMLVGIDSFSWPSQPQPGTSVYIETDIVFTFGAMKVAHGEVYAGKELLAMGDIKVWEDLGHEANSPSPVDTVFNHQGDGCSTRNDQHMAGTGDDSLYEALAGCCLQLTQVGKEALRLEASAQLQFPPDFPGFQGHFLPIGRLAVVPAQPFTRKSNSREPSALTSR